VHVSLYDLCCTYIQDIDTKSTADSSPISETMTTPRRGRRSIQSPARSPAQTTSPPSEPAITPRRGRRSIQSPARSPVQTTSPARRSPGRPPRSPGRPRKHSPIGQVTSTTGDDHLGKLFCYQKYCLATSVQVTLINEVLFL
jgi:hypothetical protein